MVNQPDPKVMAFLAAHLKTVLCGEQVWFGHGSGPKVAFESRQAKLGKGGFKMSG
jgi:hypothetical protein